MQDIVEKAHSLTNNAGAAWENTQLDQLLTSHTKINSKWDPNVKYETTEENVRELLYNLGVGNYSWPKMSPKGKQYGQNTNSSQKKVAYSAPH